MTNEKIRKRVIAEIKVTYHQWRTSMINAAKHVLRSIRDGYFAFGTEGDNYATKICCQILRSLYARKKFR